MKTGSWLLGIATVALTSPLLIAQAPAGATGQCKDGSYTSAPKKQGACRGHQGVQAWFASTPDSPATAVAPAPSVPPAPAAPSPSAAAPAPASAKPSPAIATTSSRKGLAAEAASRPQAPGGGPGMVWVNTSTKVYHCAGTSFYGKTKEGKYMSEADAKAAGARADHNKPCTQ